MLTSMVGDGFSWGAGEVVDVSPALAEALCTDPPEAPRAERIEAEARTKARKGVETAVIRPPEIRG